MAEPLNRLDECIFFALFEFVPGMYDEDEDAALARERHFNERFGDLADALDLPDAPADRINRLLAEIRRRVGAATIRLDASDGDTGEFEAIDPPRRVRAVGLDLSQQGEVGHRFQDVAENHPLSG